MWNAKLQKKIYLDSRKLLFSVLHHPETLELALNLPQLALVIRSSRKICSQFLLNRQRLAIRVFGLASLSCLLR